MILCPRMTLMLHPSLVSLRGYKSMQGKKVTMSRLREASHLLVPTFQKVLTGSAAVHVGHARF